MISEAYRLRLQAKVKPDVLAWHRDKQFSYKPNLSQF